MSRKKPISGVCSPYKCGNLWFRRVEGSRFQGDIIVEISTDGTHFVPINFKAQFHLFECVADNEDRRYLASGGLGGDYTLAALNKVRMGS